MKKKNTQNKQTISGDGSHRTREKNEMLFDFDDGLLIQFFFVLRFGHVNDGNETEETIRTQ